MGMKTSGILCTICFILLMPLMAAAKNTASDSSRLTVHAARSRAGLEAFMKAYSVPVYDALSHIYSHGMTEHDRFLVLATPEHAYVQCMFHDNDRRIYCEASSGFYKNGQPALSKRALEAVQQEGFDRSDEKGNYAIDLPLYGEAGLRKATSLMMETLYFGYGADAGRVTAYAQLIAGSAHCDREIPLTDRFWQYCGEEGVTGAHNER